MTRVCRLALLPHTSDHTPSDKGLIQQAQQRPRVAIAASAVVHNGLGVRLLMSDDDTASRRGGHAVQLCLARDELPCTACNLRLLT